MLNSASIVTINNSWKRDMWSKLAKCQLKATVLSTLVLTLTIYRLLSNLKHKAVKPISWIYNGPRGNKMEFTGLFDMLY